MTVDWTRWRRVERPAVGFVRVPPSRCPTCGATWSQTGRARSPREEPMVCSCSADRRHHAWRCWCGAWAAEGCRDTSAWGAGTVPVGLEPTQSYARP